MSRPSLTLLLLTPNRVFRADFTRPGPPAQVVNFERAPGPELLPAVEAAVYAGAKVGKVVYVLATDFWVQALAMPVSRTAGLPEAELAQALNYEAEVLSGLPAFEAAVALSPLPDAVGERRFLLIQVRAADRDAISRLLHAHGSKLGGMLHPAGLPRGLGPGEALQPRLELWADAAVAVQPAKDGLDVAVSNADPQTGRWQTELAEWSLGRIWVGPDVRTPAASDLVRLDGERLSQWFAGWSIEVSARRPRVPVARALPIPLPPRTKALLAVGIAALVGIGVFLHWTNHSRTLADVRGRGDAAVMKTKQLTDLQAKAKQADERNKKLTEEVARDERLTKDIENLQGRCASLLEVLSKKPPDAMIHRIETENGEPKLVGLARRPEIVDEYFSELTPTAARLGWIVRPPHKTAMKVQADGGPWAFEIIFSPTVAPAAPPDPNTKGKKK
jgi:hypothetical protein